MLPKLNITSNNIRRHHASFLMLKKNKKYYLNKIPQLQTKILATRMKITEVYLSQSKYRQQKDKLELHSEVACNIIH